MAQIPKLINYLKAQLGCSGEEAAQIATTLDEAGFRLGMLAAGTITAEDLIELGGLKPFEAAAVMAGASAVEEIPPGGEADEFYRSISAIMKSMEYLLGWSGREIHPSEPDNRSVESGIRYARSVVDRVIPTLENVFHDLNKAVDAIKNDDVRVECRQSTPEFDLSNQADEEVEWLGGEPPQPDPVVYSPSQETPDPEVAGAYRPTLPSYEPSPYPSSKRRRSESTRSTE